MEDPKDGSTEYNGPDVGGHRNDPSMVMAQPQPPGPKAFFFYSVFFARFSTTDSTDTFSRWGMAVTS
jgi:hypothetical protein